MHIREATSNDIDEMHTIRMSVRENVLSNPLLITKDDYKNFLTVAGKGWVCETEGSVAGFAIIDVIKKNIWALFVDPPQEKKGIGSRLQKEMLTWYFTQWQDPLWLSTGVGTRAEIFYRRSGWKETGRDKNGEIIFEMDYPAWQSILSNAR